MMNHSFEHMPNQLEVLINLHNILETGGYLMIRIPIVDKYSWRKYGLNWIAIDPPRHYYLHTEKSIELLANKSGFKLEYVDYDSTDFQFIGSEQVLKGIPLRSSESYFHNKKESIFTKKEIKKFKAKAQQLNKDKDGDFAVFYLRKSSNNGSPNANNVVQ